MKPCPSCGYIVPGAWTECRRCGASLTLGGASTATASATAAPAPARALAAVPAALADDALLPGGHRVNGRSLERPPPERPAGPDTWLPRIDPATLVHEPEQPRSRINGRVIAVGVVVLVCLVAAGNSLRPHKKESQEPTILAPRDPVAGIPTSLADVVRIEAESTRHTALAVIISAAGANGAPLTAAQLESLQPGYQWLLGTQPSTTNTMISVASAPGADVIAVSGTNRDICAYGRWSPAAGATYVTMAHVASCTAATAPASGWSPLAGGAAQDLPNELGN